MDRRRFIIAGERRSGSTTLYHALRQHPEVAMLDQPDFDFFIEPELFALQEPKKSLKNWKNQHSLDNYATIFDELTGVVGYKDADLLWWKNAHKRIKEYCANDKFIIVLRDPIKRAESQYVNELRKGREILSFEKAIQRNENELTAWQQLHLQYRERGCYVQSIQAFSSFFPKENIKVVILEELIEKWEITITEICRFLNIDSTYASSIKKIHSNKEPFFVRKKWATRGIAKTVIDIWERGTEAIIVRVTKKGEVRRSLRYKFRFFYQVSFRDTFHIAPIIIKELQEYYKPYNDALEQLLGKKIPYWKYD